MQKRLSVFVVVSMLLTFIVAFLVVTNFNSYRHPEEVEIIKKSMLKSLEAQSTMFSSNPESVDLLASFKQSIENKLTENRHRQISLLRLIGNIVALFGLTLIRNRWNVGLHIFLAGMLFCIFAGFYTYGFSFMGFAQSLGYILFTVKSVVFYWYQLNKHENQIQ